MAPKKVTDVEKPKRKIIMTMVELKKECITKWEKGTRVSDLAVQYGMAESTISTILKNREAIKAAHVAKGVKSTSKRLPAVEEVNVCMILCI
jgi:Cu2+-containing amine oxidase